MVRPTGKLLQFLEGCMELEVMAFSESTCKDWKESREEETCRKLLVVESYLFSLQLTFINGEYG